MDLKDRKVDYSYDIPYTSGYSKDGKTIYVDRKLPQFLQSEYGYKIDLFKYLLHHEVTEKTMMEAFGYDYLKAHRLALAVEFDLLQQDGILIDEYWGGSQKYYDFNELVENVTRVPLDLDIKPYLDDGRDDLVGHIITLQVAQRKAEKQGKK